MTPKAPSTFKAPYVPFKTFTNFLARLEEKGVPPKIDRSYLTWLSGLGQSQLLQALRSFGLIDADGSVTGKLRALAKSSEERPGLIAEMVRTNYAGAVALAEVNATQAQLEDEFKTSYGLSGSTLRKAIAFYLNASDYAMVPKSPNWRTPRTRESKPGARKPATRKTTEKQQTPETPGGQATDESLRARYVELLLNKAQDEMDTELLDRIERLLGYEHQAAARSEDKE
jgi:hypothetical protein